ncbi:MAG: hypothetical protein ABSC77_09060 [Terracidiphilus sp.]|jgi:hypothetical protein
MTSKSVRWQAGVLLLLLLCLPLILRAQLSKEDRAAIKGMTSGTLYLRVDLPCKYVVGNWGVGPESLLEVSPTGYSAERKLALPTHKRESVYWGFFPNSTVRYGKPSYNGETVSLDLEGVSPNHEVILDFINIRSLDDFTKAFNLAFSKVPLQDEHPEWPADVREAIATHKLIPGMTKEQAFDVTGTPINVVKGTENDVKTETWFPRQDVGTIIEVKVWHGSQIQSARSGFPALLKFKGGKLVAIEQSTRTVDLSDK